MIIKCTLHRPNKRESIHIRGFALPLALIMTAIVGILLAILASVSQSSMDQVSRREAKEITFRGSEVVLHQVLTDMSKNGLAYKFRKTLPLMSSLEDYTAYSPFDNNDPTDDRNGLPLTSSDEPGIERNYYPLGGGILKNFGPDDSNFSKYIRNEPITDQINQEFLPPNELNNPINVGHTNLKGWSQVERLDEAPPGPSSLGSDLDMSNPGRNSAVRFRITSRGQLKHRPVNGKTVFTRDINGEIGSTTVVILAEIPPS
ncbi:MAG: type II secretion system protein [Verrucomicrobiota bacterium]